MGSGISSSGANSITKRYREDFLIGKGGSGSVFLAKDLRTKTEVALKKVDLKHRNSSDLATIDICVNELECFKRISSFPFIVRLHSAYRINSSCYFALDYLGGGDLRRFIRLNGPLEEKTSAYVIACIGAALHHMHSLGVIHRDIKPENIVFDLFGRPYLTDFGISCLSSAENPIPISSSSSGTLMYLAPEVLTPTKYHSHQADFWSLGVIAYELIFQHHPFLAHCPPSIIQFSANEYSSMWTQLHSQATSSPFIDFKSIHQLARHSRFIDNQDNNILPFPNLKIDLNEDGTTPESLQIPLPHTDDDFRSLINGLLDVRIPQRLGNVRNFSEFSHHPVFEKNGIIFHQLHRITAPPLLQSSMIPLSRPRLSPASVQDPFSSFSHESMESNPQLSNLIEQKLSKFHFIVPPESQSQPLSVILFQKNSQAMTKGSTEWS
jgi:serine/threonine protein kinase